LHHQNASANIHGLATKKDRQTTILHQEGKNMMVGLSRVTLFFSLINIKKERKLYYFAIIEP
jgi:hypothetical protein